mmetsp:Transcript_29064/g.32608  ORF Transcript_29064/g.32608 Transcript_29064/m.32608 type:complete len:557 (-) Transcript_29064:182-1852(-)|eukprot:CAMPEP_0170781316 /NCGR_PEP_ID=MMETSP0733-20121128/14124_1 /TAXON_ID=186038 /ORGANISM="Fragilariopsis kerguelensis, Strain L26-C5" /LENGTH=556 /DNA_ID=CAMNT_0011125327 /DNA_START=33 /DNA_END=1703 /DNA_ORIENTATION=+
MAEQQQQQTKTGENDDKKSKEELEKEQKEAQEQLSSIMKMHKKPKNLQQGLMNGVSNIVAGAVGGLGVAVMAPTVGLAAGAQKGGVVGGFVGVTAGVAVGVLGAAGLIVGGAVVGAVNVARGVAAVPQSISAPKKGKWWNEITSEWISTDLTKIEVPDDDNDLLEGIENDLDSDNYGDGIDLHTPPVGKVKDMYYYDALQVESNADGHKIKRQYYLMARKFHPDKNPGDPAAVEKFKLAAEAYQVLSDPSLRATYDKDGRDALSGDKTSANDSQKPDPSLLLAFLFGSDKFHDYVGRLATSTSAMLGDTTKLSLNDARILQERRVARLAKKLADRIQPWVEMKFEATENNWKTQTVELVKASYGWELLQVIGMAYEVIAIQFLGSKDSGLGMPSIAKWASGRKAARQSGKARSKNHMESLIATMDGMKIQSEYEKKLLAAKSDEEKSKLEQEMTDATTNIMLRIIWTTTSVDITSTIHETCQMVFFDQSVDKGVREMRAKAVKRLGKLFQECPEPQHPEGEQINGKVLFQEAAMAATLETIKRKDEANYEAGGNDH